MAKKRPTPNVDILNKVPARTRNPEMRLLKAQLSGVDRRLHKSRWEVDILEAERKRILSQLERLLQPDLPIS